MLRICRFILPRRKENFLNCFVIGLFGVFVLIALLKLGALDTLKDAFSQSKIDDSDGGKEQADAKLDNGLKPQSRKTRTIYVPDANLKKGGPGENGNGVHLSGQEKEEGEKLMKKWFMNVVASDKISLDRTVPDTRHPDCKKVIYDEQLPTASVVVIFTNEYWSPLLRTVHSVLNRSPPDLLHEVVLLDDASDREDLGQKLDDYIKRFNGKVKLVRKKERQGLIRARLEGAKAASGDVVVFLDSHCEANVGWLEPLVQRIKDKRSAVLCPMIDAINDHTLEYPSYMGDTQVGGFSWSLFFTWIPLPARDQPKTPVDPVRSPTMAGGLFAAERKYFFEIGGYDPGMDIWGGENLELSFRTWMCGGSLEFIPCSRVGHIFRAGHPYNMTTKDVHGLNSARLAEVWLDDYKRLFYNYRKDLKTANYGDVSERKTLREKLQCHDFKWFLDNIYPEKFVPDEGVFAWGMVKNPSSLCLDTLQRDEKSRINIGLFHCQSGGSAAQMFSWSKAHEIRREESCADTAGRDGQPVWLTSCHGQGGNQMWNHTKDGSIVHINSGKCLDRTKVESGGDILVQTCNGSEGQKWTFEHYLTKGGGG